MTKRARAIGTSPAAIERAEAELCLTLPASFRDWLIENNGLGIEDISVFPIFDDRDPRKTWSSIVRESRIAQDYWADAFASHEEPFGDLLAFASFGTGDYYCFDYSAPTEAGEYMIVLVSHETGERSQRARTFAEFVTKASAGEFAHD